MPEGRIVSIHITPTAGTPTASVESVRAVAGKGLEGDRNFDGDGKHAHKPGRQVTLIEAEAIEALARDYDARIEPGASRRNIVTRGLALNHLVGKSFRAGEALLEGIQLCEPCGHLAKLAHEKVLPGLVHRGGLRCRIVTGGMIRVGDALREA